MKPLPADQRRPELERLPSCPEHLNAHAAKEWRRVARVLRDIGVLTAIDRAALAAYCQAYGRWVEAEERLQETPMLFKTPSGYVQQSPWLGIVNKQLELMGRYMVELGMTPASRSRVALPSNAVGSEPFRIIRRIVSHTPIGYPPEPGTGPMSDEAWEANYCGESADS